MERRFLASRFPWERWRPAGMSGGIGGTPAVFLPLQGPVFGRRDAGEALETPSGARCACTSATRTWNGPGSAASGETGEGAKLHTANARRLVEETGYGRRREVEWLERQLG